MKTKTKDLKLGDVVQTMEGAFGTSIVSRVTEEEVEFFRPYAVTCGFSVSGDRTICYTGVETWRLPRDYHYEYEVYRSEELR